MNEYLSRPIKAEITLDGRVFAVGTPAGVVADALRESEERNVQLGGKTYLIVRPNEPVRTILLTAGYQPVDVKSGQFAGTELVRRICALDCPVCAVYAI